MKSIIILSILVIQAMAGVAIMDKCPQITMIEIEGMSLVCKSGDHHYKEWLKERYQKTIYKFIEAGNWMEWYCISEFEPLFNKIKDNNETGRVLWDIMEGGDKYPVFSVELNGYCKKITAPGGVKTFIGHYTITQNYDMVTSNINFFGILEEDDEVAREEGMNENNAINMDVHISILEKQG